MNAQRKANDAMNAVIVELDKSHLRKMQAQMHGCSAKCYSDNSKTMEQVHSCVQACSQSLIRASQVVETEMTRFQERLERCSKGCADDANFKYNSQMNDDQKSGLQTEYERCIDRCVDENLTLLPNVTKKIRELIGKV